MIKKVFPGKGMAVLRTSVVSSLTWEELSNLDE